MNDAPFGTFALPGWAAALVRFCQGLPVTGVGKRLAFALRKPVLLMVGANAVDADVRGARFRLWPRQNLSDKRLLCTPDLLDGAERAFLAARLPRDAVLLDVGANIGGYGLLVAAARTDVRVVFVEAEPTLAGRLRANIAYSGFAARCPVVEAAAVPAPGTVTLRIDEVNRGKNSVSATREVTGAKTIQVPGFTLRQLVEQQAGGRIDALKMDIEGFEHPVLAAFYADAPRALWPRLVQIEQHRKEPDNDAVRLVRERGYREVLRTRMNVILELPA